MTRDTRLASLVQDMQDSKDRNQVLLACSISACIDYDTALAKAIELAACARELVQNIKTLDYNPEGIRP